MTRALANLLRRCANAIDPPQQSEAEFRAALKREAEDNARRRPLTPAEHLAIAVALIPSDIARSPHLLCIEKMRLEREIEAEYGPCAASREIERDIELERAKVVMPFVRKQIMRGER